GGHPVFGIASADVDDLAGETLDGVSAQAVSRLQQAMAEAAEARTFGAIVESTMLAAAAALLAVAVLWAAARARRRVTAALIAAAERTIATSSLAPLEALRSARARNAQRYVVG